MVSGIDPAACHTRSTAPPDSSGGGLPAIVLAGALLFAALAAPGTLAAQGADDPHAAQPERPTVATHAGTVAPGWLEVETGAEVDRAGHGSSEIVGPTSLKIGLAPRAQLTLSATLDRSPDGPNTVEDIGAAIKWRLVEHAPIVGDLALLPTVKLGTGAANSAAGVTELSLRVISSHDAGPVAIDANLEYTHRSGDGRDVPRTATLWTITSGGPLRGAAGWNAELYGYPGTSGLAGESPVVAFLGGPTFRVRP